MLKRLLILVLLALAALLVGLPIGRSLEQGPLDEAARAQAPGRFASLREGRTHFELAGPEDGPPVVLVHGFSVPAYVWDPTFEALAAAGFRVLRYDLFGRGWSDRPNVSYGRELFARQLGELMDSVDFARADLVGLSMGGAVIGEFAATQAQRVGRIALIAPISLGRSVAPLHLALVGEWMTTVWLLPKLAESQSSAFFHPERFADWPERFRVQMAYDGFGRAILSTLRSTIAKPALRDYGLIGRSTTPVLLIWGREDRVLPFEQHEAVLKAIPQARLLAIEQAGHLPHLEQAQTVQAALIKFLGAGQGGEVPPVAPTPPSPEAG